MINLPELNLPKQELRIQESDSQYLIWDVFRQKMISLTPEEWVRQHVLLYLVNQMAYPQARIHVEAAIRIHKLKRRCDAIVYAPDLHPQMIIECKAPHVKITDDTLMQIAHYNRTVQVKGLLISNGMTHYCLHRPNLTSSFEALSFIPDYAWLLSNA